MHPALQSQMVQSYIDDLRRAAAANSRRAEARRVAAEARDARRLELPTVPRPSVMRRVAARLAL